MTGRSNFRRGGGRGRGRGRGRRGRRYNAGQATNVEKKKSIEDYFFYVGSTKQNYETTAQYVVNHIKKTFTEGNDISEALRLLEEPDIDSWEPVQQESVSTDAATLKREDKMN